MAKAIKAMGPTDLILETEKMVKALEARDSKDFDVFLLGECAKALIRTLFNHMKYHDPLDPLGRYDPLDPLNR